ncbi:hypothetical protein LIER_15445 [Lithospermum erythrorhizon]|uniref:Uncharacterized protein n=1 Tax=Lithospermum erythrorhizon TaxID=34254 RepID=A0AAV3Q4W5_LITER
MYTFEPDSIVALPDRVGVDEGEKVVGSEADVGVECEDEEEGGGVGGDGGGDGVEDLSGGGGRKGYFFKEVCSFHPHIEHA